MLLESIFGNPCPSKLSSKKWISIAARYRTDWWCSLVSFYVHLRPLRQSLWKSKQRILWIELGELNWTVENNLCKHHCLMLGRHLSSLYLNLNGVQGYVNSYAVWMNSEMCRSLRLVDLYVEVSTTNITAMGVGARGGQGNRDFSAHLHLWWKAGHFSILQPSDMFNFSQRNCTK